MTERYETLLQQALQASARGDVQQAVEGFDEAAAADPRQATPHLLKGAELAQAGDVLGAEHAYSNALLVAPELHVARFQLGLLQFTSQRVAVALLTWQPLLALPPEDAMHHYVRGFEALARDALDPALEHFQAGLACANPNEPLAGDIRQVVDAVRRLRVTPQDEAATDQDEQVDEQSAHVLLSNYGQR